MFPNFAAEASADAAAMAGRLLRGMVIVNVPIELVNFDVHGMTLCCACDDTSLKQSAAADAAAPADTAALEVLSETQQFSRTTDGHAI